MKSKMHHNILRGYISKSIFDTGIEIPISQTLKPQRVWDIQKTSYFLSFKKRNFLIK
ncbi:MAG: hypothetical protein KJ559_01025 [Nanoarchaeota archaeon]|nr:hypothetical protein [Nanoarchaeota archaeon]